jgi:dipeptidyl aminopeptidase/acylaminoacyl peptidase
VLRDGGSYGDLQIAADGKTLVFTRASLAAPAEIYKAGVDGRTITPVTYVNAKLLAPFDLKPGESVSWEGAGGTKIQGWIVRPNNFAQGQKYPLLYLVHGGPQGAWNDAWTYRWNAQVFASAGYVVVMPNPRGSTGFGQQFTDEISGDWGGKVFEDLMKGVDFAEQLPYVDRSRKGAAGASFGGYMMDWFLGHTDRFKAIVSHAGVFNLTSMYGVTEELWFPEWDLKGTPWSNPELYAKFSPHTYAKNFKTPTLVTHGELDFRVPVGEGLQLFTTLQRLGVPSRLLYFPDEGHWINKPQNSALWYHTFLEWMGKWVK